MKFFTHHNVSSMTAKLIISLFKNLSSTRYFQLFLASLLALASSILELLSVFAVSPLIIILQGKSISSFPLFSSGPLSIIASNTFISSASLSDIVSFFITLIILVALFRSANAYFSGQIAAYVSTDISTMAYNGILSQDFDLFESRSRSSYLSILTSHSDNISLSINFLFQAFSGLITTLLILFGLFSLDYRVALFIFSFLILSYLVVLRFTKVKLSINSNLIANSRVSIHDTSNDSLMLFKDVLMRSHQSFFIDRFFRQDHKLRVLLAQNIFIGNFPRFIVEAVGLILIAISALYLNSNNSSDITFAIIGTIALGLQRLLPSIQQVYNGIAIVRSSYKSLNELLDYSTRDLKFPFLLSRSNKDFYFSELSFNNVDYAYPNSSSLSLNRISFDFKKGECLGLVGKTGSGKSTLIELIMALRSPLAGTIFLNGIDISSPKSTYLPLWRESISYVPQTIHLCNMTIAQNIAFGIPPHLIDYGLLEYVAKKACIFDFITSTPLGFSTVIGDSSWTLSGGQSQRIGLARALYSRPQVLLLDEVTSSLDSNTESKLINSILSLNDDGLSIISIAHRTKAVAMSAKLLRLSDGRIVS